MRAGLWIAAVIWVLAASPNGRAGPGAKIVSHPPMRPLPSPPPGKPLTAEEKKVGLFVDPVRGDDAGDGSEARPWRTFGHAAARLRPGDTLYLRGGTYYEHVTLKLAGTAEQPITVRAYPGELPVLDGGLRAFFDDPAGAWEPFSGGAAGEFRSKKAYPGLGPIVLGHFGDSMVPLHGYRFPADLRSENEFWNLPHNASAEHGIYCGPGLWYDAKTGYIHARLAHTKLAPLGADNYRGVTDPRDVPLVVAGAGVPLRLEGCKHLRVVGLVVRGASRAAVSITGGLAVELAGVTVHGGSPGLDVQATVGLRLVNCALRGISAPWSFRTHHKYRGVAAYLLTARPGKAPNRDFEIARCDLTDSHDGPYLGTVKGLKLHHSRVDNFNDDGVYLTAAGEGGDLHVYQNHLSRCLHVFAFHGNYEPGSGVWIYRNVIDLRPPVHYFQPKGPDDDRFRPKVPGAPPEVPSRGRLCGDHGGPTWEPVWFYHNTVLSSEPAFRDFYAAGWGGHLARTRRRVFNNVFVQLAGNPGLKFSDPDADLQADGNLLWGVWHGPAVKGDYFAAFRRSAPFAASKKHYPPGWTARDVFADPKFARFAPDWRAPLDVRLRSDSPAVNAGVALPGDWPDPLRARDPGPPDIGALPAGAEPFRAGAPPHR